MTVDSSTCKRDGRCAKVWPPRLFRHEPKAVPNVVRTAKCVPYGLAIQFRIWISTVRLSQAIVVAMVLNALSATTAWASKWTGPTLVVVEAQGFVRLTCPRQGRLRAGHDGSTWVLPSSGICLRARWTKLLEAHNPWPQAMTDAFMQSMGKHVYLSATQVPSEPALLLLVPGPIYGKERPNIVGAQIRARLLGSDQRFAQIDANVLRPSSPDDKVYRDTLHLELRWLVWKVGHISTGPSSTTNLTLLLKSTCLPGPVELGQCAAYAVIGRSGDDPIPSTNQVLGVLTFASRPTTLLTTTFEGTLLLDVRTSSGDNSSQTSRLVHLRVAGGEIEETPLPSAAASISSP
jgi:hypothetical protein